ncbi:MAG: glycoside hydrolase family 25 protein [Longimicrobiaceae bacterium]
MLLARVSLASILLLPALAHTWRASSDPALLPTAIVRAPATQARGIDVSHHQGRIDWRAVAGEGIGFAYMKATEGETFTDPVFARNWSGAADAGIARGAYHRFRPGRDAVAQADHFLSVVSLRAGDLPPVLDVESTGGVSDARLVRGVRAWLAEVERRTGVRPIVYTKPGFRRAHLGTALDGYPLWIAEYGVDSPSVDPWHLWQHSERGRVAGIGTAVDLDRFNGTRAELRALAISPAPGERLARR